MADVRHVDVVVREEPAVSHRPYRYDPESGVELYFGEGGRLVKVSYLPEKFPGMERVKDVIAECPLCNLDLDTVLKSMRSASSERKVLNSPRGDSRSSVEKVVTYKEVGVVYAGQFVAKGAELGFDQVDIYTGKTGIQPHLRPSTWLNMGLGVVLPIASVMLKLRSPWDMVLISMGGHMMTKVVDYAQEYMPAAAAGAVSYGAGPVYLPSSGAVSPPAAAGGKYRITA